MLRVRPANRGARRPHVPRELRAALLGAVVLAGSCADVLGLGPERHLTVPDGAGAEALGGGAAAAEANGGEALAAIGGVASNEAGASSRGGVGPESGGASVGALGGDAGVGTGGEAGIGMGGVKQAGNAGSDGGPTLPHNCSELLAADPDAASGVSLIDADGPGPLAPMQASCDQDTDGGGWTLVLDYLHLGGSNPELRLLTEKLPLLGSSTLGNDESGTQHWGHASNDLIAALGASELRFYGITAAHGRVVHFKTQLPACVSYARTGYLGCRGLEASFTPLAGHTAKMPALADSFSHNRRNDALTEFPFALYGDSHWAIGGGGYRWEVDNFWDESADTLHRVFVRSGPAPVVSSVDGGALEGDLAQASVVQAPVLGSCRELKEQDDTLPSGLYTIKSSSEKYSVYCNMQLDGGGYTVFFAVLNGQSQVLAHFDDPEDSCPDPQRQCLRHLPPSLDTTVELIASCGAKAIKFFANDATLAYLQLGTQAAWQPLTSSLGLHGGDPTLAQSMWTGAPGNEGLIIADESAPQRTFLASYSWNNEWDYCNGQEQGGSPSPIRLMYR